MLTLSVVCEINNNNTFQWWCSI